MKSIHKILFYALLILLTGSYSASSQGLLKKMGQKVGKEAEKMLDKSLDKGDNSGTTGANPNPNTDNSGTNNQQVGEGTGSGGVYGLQTQTSSTGRKKMTPPDVKKSISDAETAFKSKSYDDTRFNIQQALIGIELEIGYQILNSMPKNIDGLDFKEEDDQVMSNGSGFAGFHVERSYYKDEKSMDVNILNNEAMITGLNMAMSNPAYMNSSNNQKSVKVGNFRAVMTAEENGSFSLSIPLGQASLIAMSFRDYKDENEVLKSAQTIDIASIKTMLGEQ
jgi:hypothetical protein